MSDDQVEYILAKLKVCRHKLELLYLFSLMRKTF